ncbi:hypothetical protein GCM10011574_33720 [Microbispora bryophytorum]|uniref:Uncharacterized protein n=1 Tax=Microbispora bryophytorum TaxID=1460882 RepID=A0A8H9LE27_9ACTN|nr:hypothetical protein GCM10011574_33720 [Microbispora bryophytorum]
METFPKLVKTSTETFGLPGQAAYAKSVKQMASALRNFRLPGDWAGERDESFTTRLSPVSWDVAETPQLGCTRTLYGAVHKYQGP